MQKKSLKLWRTFREGLQNFRRNGWLSFATISILSLSLFILGMAYLISRGTSELVRSLEKNISLTVSFNPDIPEDRILAMRDDLSHFREIDGIKYTSRTQALDSFLAQSKDNPSIQEAVDVLGENPLLASLDIHARDQGDYEKIASILKNSQYQNDISSINYEKNKDAFARLNRLASIARKLGLILGLAFALIAILITFNTVRITIYSHRQEFEIMRLVGASNLYVRMPFVFEGLLYGLFASLLALIAVGIAAYSLSSLTRALPQGSLFHLFLEELPLMSIGLVALGILLGVLSSFIAIRRYLKV